MTAVVLFGTTGRTGGQLLFTCLARGPRVTAVVRDPERFLDRRRCRQPTRTGLWCAAGTCVTSYRCALPSLGTTLSSPRSGPLGARLTTQAVRSLVPATTELGVRRLVVMSSAGVRHDDPSFAWWYRLVARTLLRALRRHGADGTPRARQRAGLNHRPAYAGHRRPASGAVRVLDGATPPGGRQVPLVDLCDFIVDELTVPRWLRKAPTLAF